MTSLATNSPATEHEKRPDDVARRVRDPLPRDVDAVVVGAGFGGLAAALRLAERGASVLLTETLNYPGGCASTFSRDGYRFESGATLFSGLGEGQLFRHWIDRYGLDVHVDWLDPVIELRAPDLTLPVPARRSGLLERFLAMPGAPAEGLRDFFALQERVADVLWEVLGDPSLLPPFGLRALGRHALRAHRVLPLAGVLGRSLHHVLSRYGLDRFPPFALYADALCQITLQCSAAEAEAPFALGVMDYYFRGTGHVRGGIGELAHGLVDAIREAGGRVTLANRVTALQRSDRGWIVRTRRGDVRTRTVVANLLPQAVTTLVVPAEDLRGAHRLQRLNRRVEEGWGACMLYLAFERQAPLDGHEAGAPFHLQVVQEWPTRDERGRLRAPLAAGDHFFVSARGVGEGDCAPPGWSTATVSTHVSIGELRALDPAAQAARVQEIQDRMRAGLERFAPEVARHVRHELPASPRTFERFTGRPHGYVGGVPRRRGLSNYLDLGLTEPFPGLFLVGDTVFPGQSTLATALGGWKVADRVAARVS